MFSIQTSIHSSRAGSRTTPRPLPSAGTRYLNTFRQRCDIQPVCVPAPVPAHRSSSAAQGAEGQPLTGLPRALPASQSSQDFAQGVGPLPNWSFREVPVTSMMSPRWVNS